MTDPQDVNLARLWIRSSHCTPGKNCVEIGRCDTMVIIRDSKSRSTLGELEVAPWMAFLAHCRARVGR